MPKYNSTYTLFLRLLVCVSVIRYRFCAYSESVYLFT